MKFNKLLDSPIIKNHTGVKLREAVRAIIFKKNKILLVHSSRGDYKLPGGGVEEDESYAEALVREVSEETGYIYCNVKDLIGIVTERKMDEFANGHVFQMTSQYYLCELTNEETVDLELDAYESVLEFTSKWVDIEDAIKQNESLITQFENNSWLIREAYVLNEVKKYIK